MKGGITLERLTYLFVFISAFFIFTAGCSTLHVSQETTLTPSDKPQESTIPTTTNGSQEYIMIVHKRVGEENKFQSFKEIKDKNRVQKAMHITQNIEWSNAKVSMAFPPHYKFRFVGNDDKSVLLYDLWVSPNKDQVELVTPVEGNYVQLSKTTSAELFEIITGEK